MIRWTAGTLLLCAVSSLLTFAAADMALMAGFSSQDVSRCVLGVLLAFAISAEIALLWSYREEAND